jgi:hypothetical protein
MVSAENPCWEWKENSQIFNEDFYLPLYLPLWIGVTIFKNKKCNDQGLVLFPFLIKKV